MYQQQEELQHRSAEWCQHDDVNLHWEGANGERTNIRTKFTGLTMPEIFREWHKHKAGNIRLTGATDRPHIMVLGPPCKWKVVHIDGDSGHGYTLDQDADIEYAPGQSVVFTMSKS